MRRGPPRSTLVPYTTLFRSRDPREALAALQRIEQAGLHALSAMDRAVDALRDAGPAADPLRGGTGERTPPADRKSTRLNSSHANISDAVFCLKKRSGSVAAQ